MSRLSGACCLLCVCDDYCCGRCDAWSGDTYACRVLIVVAMLRPQDDRGDNSDDPAQHASEKKKSEEEEEKVSMCMHVYAFLCI